MQKHILIALSLLLGVFQSTDSQAQFRGTVHSVNGYDVNLEFFIKEVVAPSSCPWGYNYNLVIDYNITFTGENIPSSMYSLQGYLTCGSNADNYFNIPVDGGQGSSTTTGNPWRSVNDCESATPESLSCELMRVDIQGPGIEQNSVYLNRSPLPIELLSFKASQPSDKVQLDWITAAEVNNDYFSIERSKDGMEWEVIGTLNGAGNSSQTLSYSLTDEDPLYGITYYRLKQTDFDGAFSYSNIEAVERSASSYTGLSIYPNPSTEHVVIKSSQHDLSRIHLFNMCGQEMSDFVTIVSEGEDMLIIDVSSLPTGHYSLVDSQGAAIDRLVRL